MSFNYEQIQPGHYDEVFRRRQGIQSSWHHLKFQVVKEALGPLDRHLDIGCGPGTLIGLLADSGVLVGIDVSKNQTDYAQETYGTNHKKFLSLTHDKLPFSDNYFQSVSLVELIEHLPADEIQQLLSEARRVLIPGGKIILTTPNYSSLWPVLEWLLNHLGSVSYEDQHITRFNRKSLKKMLAQTGFNNIQVSGCQFLAPFAAAISWRLANSVHKREPRFLVNRFGFLLLAKGFSS